MLCLVGDRGTPAAQKAVADALVDALRSGRLPAGRRAAWGASLRPGVSTGATLGPLEYLCAWYAEPADADTPSAARFDSSLRHLLVLLSQSERAATLYQARLRALAQDPLGGTLSRQTRQALMSLADAWQATPGAPAAVVDALLQKLGGGLGAFSSALPAVTPHR